MANSAVQLFSALMESRDIKVKVIEQDENVCQVGFELKNTSVLIFVHFSEDCTDVHFAGYEFIKIPKDKEGAVYKLCNECNDRFRWVKFVWDEERETVSCQADAVIQLDSCAEECFDIVMRMAKIVDDAYPIFMKAMWS